MNENLEDSVGNKLARIASDIAIVSYSSALIGISALAKNAYLAYSQARARISKALNFPPQGEIKTERIILDNDALDFNISGRVVNRGTLYLPAKSVKEEKGLSRFLHLDGINSGYVAEFVDYVPKI